MMRISGAALIVPPMEELFWRSLVMRWVDQRDFLACPAASVTLRALVFSSVAFGVEHPLWFAGVLAGLVYGGLYRMSGSLWVAIVAHAVTNLALGIWVVGGAHWDFW